MTEARVRHSSKEKSIFGKILFKYRRANNISLKDYASRTNNTMAHVRWIEKQKNPCFNDMRDIERIFDLSPGSVYFEYMAELARIGRTGE